MFKPMGRMFKPMGRMFEWTGRMPIPHLISNQIKLNLLKIIVEKLKRCL
jgi:hypothetical protein